MKDKTIHFGKIGDGKFLCEEDLLFDVEYKFTTTKMDVTCKVCFAKLEVIHGLRGAVFSNDRKHRFQLWRIWDTSKPFVLWIMHNPSTATEIEDDPTIRRIIQFSKSWGYGGIYVGNLFSRRATDPKRLKGLKVEELQPIEQMSHTNEMIAKCSLHILAYGNPFDKSFTREMFDDHWYCLKKTKDGNPSHPLYLKKDLKPIKFNNGNDNIQ